MTRMDETETVSSGEKKKDSKEEGKKEKKMALLGAVR